MLFSSLVFLFGFLPGMLLIYFLLPWRFRNVCLLLGSLFFYAWGEPRFVFVMMGSIIFNYAMARGIAGKLESIRGGQESSTTAKQFMVAAVVGNLALLFVFKYLDFTLANINRLLGLELTLPGITLPIGISFFTFQAMSYVVDVYRGEVAVQKNILHLGLYIALFPQLIAGPIVRYKDVVQQILSRGITLDSFSTGLERFLAGLAKKVILANNLALAADLAFASEADGSASVALLWLGAVAYTLQIYFDFSGYSDMAIGLGQMFGFRIKENFNYPYLARSVTDFWRRWHMSLSSWFRDYVYIPLGGNRRGLRRQVLNLFVVWTLTGIWHGAAWTFVAWGMAYFLLLTAEKILRIEKMEGTLFRLLYRGWTLLAVTCCWVLFRSEGLHQAVSYLKGMFFMDGLPLFSYGAARCLGEQGIIGAVALICAFFSVPLVEWMKKEQLGAVLLRRSLLLFAMVYAVSYLVMGAHNPFIYFNF